VTIKTRIWEIVEVAKPGDTFSRIFDVTVLSLIIINVISVIVGSVNPIYERWGAVLDAIEVVSVVVFTVEYAARIWSCTTDPRFQKPLLGRIRFALQAMSVIDLLAILPFYLPFWGVDLRSMRVLRLFRILRIAKAGRYFTSLGLIRDVLRTNKEELILTSAMMALLLVISSSILYYCENEAQPEAFASIPHTMWWAIATLTTVGYGDVAPVTGIGRTFASVIAVIGIGMFALPAGILGAGFVEAIQRRKKREDEAKKEEDVRNFCPHCGKRLR
jgi:voltage-gated potassium channel